MNVNLNCHYISRMRHIRGGRLCVCLCLSVCPSPTATVLHRPGCNLGNARGCLWLYTIGRICNRCTGLVAMTTYTYVSLTYTLQTRIAPNAKCQRVLVLALWLVTLAVKTVSTASCNKNSPDVIANVNFLRRHRACRDSATPIEPTS